MSNTNGEKIKVDIKTSAHTLNLGTGNLWQKVGLNSNTILQSFAIDYKDKNIYIAQCKTGKTNPDQGATQGDIDINKVDYAGNKRSVIECLHSDGWDNKSSLKYNDEFNEYNYTKHNVRGFGHATQIALEYAPDGKYLWLDYDSPCVDRAKDKAEGITDYYIVGKRLARIHAKDNSTFKYDDSRIRTFTLTKRIKGLLDSDFATVSIYNVNGLLAVKYIDNNYIMKVTIFKMEYNKDYLTSHNMSDIVFTELKTFDSPSVKWPKASITGNGKKVFGNLTPNGWVIFGDYVYFMAGTAYWAKTTQSGQTEWYSPTPKMVEEGCHRYNTDGSYIKETKVGNAHLMCVNWKTG